MLGSITTVAADSGVYKNGKVTLNESGVNETYDTICVDENRIIYDNTKVNTTNNITIRDGALDYFVDNYHNTSSDELQNGMWNITQNTSLPFVTYEDYYKAQKVLNSTKLVTVEEINGSNYTVTRWTSETYDFLFRMVGDGWNIGIQDLLIYKVDYIKNLIEEFELIPIEDPVDPVGPIDPVDPVDPIDPIDPIDPVDPVDPVDPIDPVDTVNNTNSNDSNDSPAAVSAAMKETGIPIIAVLLVLLASLGLVVVRKK
ncbi:hypothetical protein [Methanobrevibacter arboriphilus]|nr:hypothetical protein [Methanobrevibacter arboriphilus]